MTSAADACPPWLFVTRFNRRSGDFVRRLLLDRVTSLCDGKTDDKLWVTALGCEVCLIQVIVALCRIMSSFHRGVLFTPLPLFSFLFLGSVCRCVKGRCSAVSVVKVMFSRREKVFDPVCHSTLTVVGSKVAVFDNCHTCRRQGRRVNGLAVNNCRRK